jgi:hypothetical protein
MGDRLTARDRDRRKIRSTETGQRGGDDSLLSCKRQLRGPGRRVVRHGAIPSHRFTRSRAGALNEQLLVPSLGPVRPWGPSVLQLRSRLIFFFAWRRGSCGGASTGSLRRVRLSPRRRASVRVRRGRISRLGLDGENRGAPKMLSSPGPPFYQRLQIDTLQLCCL